jgi:hypothetical protein
MRCGATTELHPVNSEGAIVSRPAPSKLHSRNWRRCISVDFDNRDEERYNREERKKRINCLDFIDIP